MTGLKKTIEGSTVNTEEGRTRDRETEREGKRYRVEGRRGREGERGDVRGGTAREGPSRSYIKVCRFT